MIPERRSIKQMEDDVIRATLDRAKVRNIDPDAVASLTSLNVISRCECGCASVDFEEHRSTHRSKPIGDGIGKTERGGQVGIIVWGYQDAITGIEINELGTGDEDLTLPVPTSIMPWEKSRKG